MILLVAIFSSVENINAIVDDYSNDPHNDKALQRLLKCVPTLNLLQTANVTLLIGMNIGFAIDYVTNGRDVRQSVFKKGKSMGK